ncbi:MAG: FMN-dependent NADH-azoreductase [Kangiella sp.]|nr:MAG: FMN-dependent NADH-azoreductase [Kangiella sp.]
MTQQNILLVNSSGRFEGSVTRQLSQLIVEQLKVGADNSNLVTRELTEGLPFINEEWIGATFTPVENRNQAQKHVLEFSDELVNELQLADTIVIASPIYNFSIPAVLKAWIDLTARAQLTFKYTENGPIGLIENKKIYVAIASGGVPIGSAMDFASPYLKQALGFIGLTDVTIVDASSINLAGDKNEKVAKAQIAELLEPVKSGEQESN